MEEKKVYKTAYTDKGQWIPEIVEFRKKFTKHVRKEYKGLRKLGYSHETITLMMQETIWIESTFLQLLEIK